MKLDKIRKDVEESEVFMKGDYPYVVLSLCTGVPEIDPDSYQEAIDAMCEIGEFDCDLIISPEAMGILYGGPVSLRTAVPMMILKKKSTLPGREVVIESTTGYSKNRFYLPFMSKGLRVAIVDDIISTGGTVKELVANLRDMGVVVTEVVCLLNKSKDVKKLEKEIGVPIKTVITIEIVDGKARVI